MTHIGPYQLIMMYLATFSGAILGVLFCYPLYMVMDYILDKVFKR